MKLVLVRHGRAGHRSAWKGDDRLRPLSRQGRAQAEGLVPMLSGFQPDRVISSPFVRCVQTVEPLAATLGKKVEDAEELAEGNGHKAIELVRGLADDGGAFVLCSHGDIIPEVIDHLTQTDGMRLPDDAHCAKGSAWVLTNHDGRFVAAAYLDPPPSPSA